MLAVGSILLMAVHFLAVDVATAGPLACVWLARRAARHKEPLAAVLEIWLARASVAALGISIATGSLQLWVLYLVNDRDFWRAVAAIPAGRLWFSLAELVFFVVCMIGYLRLARRPVKWPRLATALALLASLDLMYHFPPLFTIVHLLADRPGLFGQELTRPLYRSLLIDPEVIGMAVHVYLAAIAVTALLVAAQAARFAAGKVSGPAALVVSSARAALLATFLQMPVGVSLLVGLPGRLRDALLGDDLLATTPFACAILATVGLLQPLAAIALGDCEPRQIRRAWLLLLATILLMTATLHRIRQLGRPAAGENDETVRVSVVGGHGEG